MKNNESQVFNNGEESKSSQVLSSAGFLGKTFLYMFLGLLISAAICLGLSNLLYYTLSQGSSTVSDQTFGTYLTILIISAIGLLILSIVISVKQIKMHNILVPYILYCVFMGVLLSSLVVFVGDPNILGTALGISSIIFLTMCLFGFLYKGKLGWVFGLLIGGAISMGVLFLVNLFLFPLAFGVSSAFDAYCTIYWISEGIFFVMIMVSTFLDMYNIRRIGESGADQTNLSLYCALNLYSDFIMLFIRVLYFLILAGGRKND
jgi:FtsH-binding integral membrane protein